MKLQPTSVAVSLFSASCYEHLSNASLGVVNRTVDNKPILKCLMLGLFYFRAFHAPIYEDHHQVDFTYYVCCY
jgi:hypothetical protein